MPDLPGAADEPYDRRFVKWMIKNKVGWASAYGCVCFTGCVLLRAPDPRADGPKSSPASALSRGSRLYPFQGKESLFLMCSNRPCGLAGIPTLSGPQSSHLYNEALAR